MKRVLIIAALAAVCLLALVFFKPLMWAVDVLTERERIIARQRLPEGGCIEVFQYWNSDFYNLSLRHITEDGNQFECVIDPDCYRISSCQIDVNTNRGDVAIAARYGISSRYHWVSKELTRKNGVLIHADPTPQTAKGSVPANGEMK